MPRTLHTDAPLSNESIAALHPRSDGRRYEIADPGCPGLRLKVGPRLKVWVWYLQEPMGDGRTKTRVITIGPWAREPGTPNHLSVHEARAVLDELRKARGEGHLGEAVAALKHRRGRQAETLTTTPLPYTVSDLVAEWLARLRADGVESADELARTMDRDVLAFIGSRPAAQVRTVELGELVARVVARGSRVQAGKVLSYLKAAFDHARSIGKLDVDPTGPLKAKRLGARKGERDRVLTEGEMCLAWEWFDPAKPLRCTPVVAATIRLLLLLPVRSGEVREARWSDLDERNALLVVPPERLKGRRNGTAPRPWRTPVGPAAMEVLKVMRGLSAGSEWICRSPNPGDRDHLSERALCAAVRRVLTRAGVPKERRWRPHDLRRTARTHIGQWVPEDVAERVIGHRRPGVIDTYDRSEYLPERRAALEKWEAWVLDLVERGGVAPERA